MIIIPGLHPSLNQWTSWHHFRRHKEKQHWEEVVGWAAKGHEKYTGSVDVVVTYYFKDKRARDLDNYVPKFYMDGLVKAGIIEDDKSSILQSLGIRIRHDKANPRTEIEIKSIQDRA